MDEDRLHEQLRHENRHAVPQIHAITAFSVGAENFLPNLSLVFN